MHELVCVIPYHGGIFLFFFDYFFCIFFNIEIALFRLVKYYLFSAMLFHAIILGGARLGWTGLLIDSFFLYCTCINICILSL